MATVERSVKQAVGLVGRDLGLSTEELDAALAVPAQTVSWWLAAEGLAEDDVPLGALQDRLAELESLRRRLHRLFEPEAVPLWLRTPNRYLGGAIPADLLVAGRAERVEAALEAVESGFFV